MSEATERKATQQVELEERTSQALQLRRRGLTYESISQALGLKGRGQAYEIVQRGLRKIVTEPAKALKKVEDEKLQAAAEQVGRILFGGQSTCPKCNGVGGTVSEKTCPGCNGVGKVEPTAKMRLAAANTWLRIHEKRAKLWGLESPIQIVPLA